MNAKKKISLVAPFYNEEKNVRAFFDRIASVFAPELDKYEFEVVCVNDGSKDRTLDELLAIKHSLVLVRIVDFSRNFGKEAALTAGLDYAQGDIVVPIDADLQHPPETVLKMLRLWEEGWEVVLAKRIDRSTDRAIQKITAKAFYEFSRHITHVEIPADVGDFRLMDRKVVDALKQLRENTRFMKGIFAWVGFKTTSVEYAVEPRTQGSTKFNTWKLWNFALEGISSFSTVPLRVWTYLGAAMSGLSLLYAIYLIIKTAVLGVETPGFASLMVAILLLSGVQLIGIGVLGEYIGRVFTEVKGRPLYVVRDIFDQ
jgi:glycosyltransferase involved in cell wall biosynthesis